MPSDGFLVTKAGRVEKATSVVTRGNLTRLKGHARHDATLLSCSDGGDDLTSRRFSQR